jgi:hypothetical protein
MWIFAFAVIGLIVGNVLRKVGLEAGRANSYGSAAAPDALARPGADPLYLNRLAAVARWSLAPSDPALSISTAP